MACRGPAKPFRRGIRLRFTAHPFGCHLYHCHSFPLRRHLHKGLYGAYCHRPRSPTPPRTRRGGPLTLAGDPRKRRLAGNGHGDERLRHQLRRGKRGLRGEFHRVPPFTKAHPYRPGSAVRVYLVKPDRIRPHQFLSSARQLSSTTTSRHDADADTQDRRHRHAVAQPSAASSSFLSKDHEPVPTCSTPIRPSSAELGWMSRFEVVWMTAAWTRALLPLAISVAIAPSRDHAAAGFPVCRVPPVEN